MSTLAKMRGTNSSRNPKDRSGSPGGAGSRLSGGGAVVRVGAARVAVLELVVHRARVLHDDRALNGLGDHAVIGKHAAAGRRDDDMGVGEVGVDARAAGGFRRREGQHMLKVDQVVGRLVGGEVLVSGPGAELADLMAAVLRLLQKEDRPGRQAQPASADGNDRLRDLSFTIHRLGPFLG